MSKGQTWTEKRDSARLLKIIGVTRTLHVLTSLSEMEMLRPLSPDNDSQPYKRRMQARGQCVPLISILLLGLFVPPCGGQQQPDSALPQEFTAMRSALCDRTVDFTETGCKVCPAFMTKSTEQPLGGGLGITRVLFGSFTSVGKTEALLSSGLSCFSHADGFASAFLLRKEQGSWRRLSFFHRDGPMGVCQKIPGQSDRPDLLVCNYEDYGAGAISVIGFDGNGKVKAESVLVQTWTFPFRSLEKQKRCSSLEADVRKVSFDSIEMSIFPNSFDVDPPIICDESDYTTSKISNSKKIEAIAVFTRIDDNFVPDERTKKLLLEVEKSR